MYARSVGLGPAGGVDAGRMLSRAQHNHRLRAELRHDLMGEAIHLGDQVRGWAGGPQHEFGQTRFDIVGDLVTTFLGGADGPKRLDMVTIGHALAKTFRHRMCVL
jgi:hypothetical protein